MSATKDQVVVLGARVKVDAGSGMERPGRMATSVNGEPVRVCERWEEETKV